jgi:two-component system OmpR family response regulator
MADTDQVPRVLVVDDELNIRELVQVALKFHGCAVSVAATGRDALRLAETSSPDLIVLDVMLPDIDGFEVCRRLRAAGNEVPVIFLTARDTSSDTVTGLAIGGDDYVTKPFSVEALVARVRAVLRRTRRTGDGSPAGAGQPLRVADLELDEDRWTVHRGGVAVDLSPTEFRLLAYLMRHQGRVLTRAQILENVWGWDYAGQSQIVETYVSYLRRKLDPLGTPLIYTQRGVGYSLRPVTTPGRADRPDDRVGATATGRMEDARQAGQGNQVRQPGPGTQSGQGNQARQPGPGTQSGQGNQARQPGQWNQAGNAGRGNQAGQADRSRWPGG